MRVEWIIVVEDDLSRSAEAQSEFDRWLSRHGLEHPPAHAMRVDVIRATPVDRVRYRVHVPWLAGWELVEREE
jgi:hypothetical protein